MKSNSYHDYCIVNISSSFYFKLNQDVVIAGGMESLSNTPFYLKRGSIPYGGMSLTDGCNHDALTDAYTNWHMGDCAENTVKKMGISREDQDRYAKMSYE